jgi:hypothetical protein
MLVFRKIALETEPTNYLGSPVVINQNLILTSPFIARKKAEHQIYVLKSESTVDSTYPVFLLKSLFIKDS